MCQGYEGNLDYSVSTDRGNSLCGVTGSESRKDPARRRRIGTFGRRGRELDSTI